jgi:hypothetical protein
VAEPHERGALAKASFEARTRAQRVPRGDRISLGYVRFVTEALGDYTSDILALGEEGPQIFG